MESEQQIRAELERQLAKHGTVPGQEHAPALYPIVLAATAKACDVTPLAVLVVHRRMWAERREAA